VVNGRRLIIHRMTSADSWRYIKWKLLREQSELNYCVYLLSN